MVLNVLPDNANYLWTFFQTCKDSYCSTNKNQSFKCTLGNPNRYQLSSLEIGHCSTMVVREHRLAWDSRAKRLTSFIENCPYSHWFLKHFVNFTWDCLSRLGRSNMALVTKCIHCGLLFLIIFCCIRLWKRLTRPFEMH